MADHAQILGIKNVRTTLIFIYRHIFAGPGFLHNGIFPPAGMGAGALVGVPAHKEVAQQAAP